WADCGPLPHENVVRALGRSPRASKNLIIRGSLIYIAQHWLMVARNRQLVRRIKLKEVTTHEPGADLISAREHLHFGFGPIMSLVRFLGADETRALQHGHVGRVPLASRLGEHVNRRNDGIAAHHAADGAKKYTFAIASGAIEELKIIFAHVARKRIA